LNFQMSSAEPGTALRLMLRYTGWSAPANLSGSKPAARSSGQWSRFGMRVPLPVHFEQKIEQPCENQLRGHSSRGPSRDFRAESRGAGTGAKCTYKQLCPAEHSEVPLMQWHVYGSMSPVSGNLPCDHGGRSASTEFLEGGMIIEPCASVREARVVSAVSAAKAPRIYDSCTNTHWRQAQVLSSGSCVVTG
jgi:hypothetical protein